jgi:CDP-alcohol phosphatidyltransferase-like enzyme
VVVLRLRELTHPVHESERLAEVAESERSLERAVHLVPTRLLGHVGSMPVTTIRLAMGATCEPDETPRASGMFVEGRKRRSRPELLVEALFGPLAHLVVRALLPLPISPTVVVLANAVAGLTAAVAIAGGQLVTAALLLQVKTVLDNADGRLARASGRTSVVGRYLDTEADLVVNIALFAALANETGAPILAFAALIALTVVLSVGFNEEALYRRARGEIVVTEPSAESEGPVAHALAWLYRLVFSPQDRALQALSTGRLEHLLAGVTEPDRRRRVTLAYHDRFSSIVRANLGLSTQLALLGVCLALGEPVVYLWLVLGCAALLPALQIRREVAARRVLAAAA